MKATDWKLGVSTVVWRHKEDILGRQMFEEYKKAGIDCLEISLNHEDYAKMDYKKTYELAKEYGVELWSYHLPFVIYDCANLDANERKALIEYYCDIIKKASDIGVKIFVIHPSAEPYTDEERGDRIKASKEILSALAEFADKCDSIIAVENLPRSCLGNCISDMKELLSADDRLKVCFDTNHLLLQDNIQFIKELGDKICTIHVSDYDFLNEKHWFPYEGDIDWIELVTALEDVGYNGPFMYELRVKAPETLIRRDLTLDDYRENYLALINKKVPKIYGKRNAEKVEKNAYYKTKQF